MSRGRRVAAWSAAILAAALIHAGVLAGLGLRFSPAGSGAAGQRGAGVKLALVTAAPHSPEPDLPATGSDASTPPASRPRPQPAPPSPVQAPTPRPEPPAEAAAPLIAAAASDRGDEDGSPGRADAPEPGGEDAAPAASQSGATGSSGGGEAGAGGAAARAYQDLLSTRVQGCLRYPQRALRRRIAGDVALALAIAADGALEDASLVDGSGSALLDGDALATVRRCAPYPAPPAPGRYEIVLGYDLLSR